MFTPSSLPAKKQEFTTFGKITVVLGYSAIVLGLLVVLGTLGLLQNGFSEQKAQVAGTEESQRETLDSTVTTEYTHLDSGNTDSVAMTDSSINTISTTSGSGGVPGSITSIKPLVAAVDFRNLPSDPVFDRDIEVLLTLTNAHTPRLLLVAPALNYQKEIEGREVAAGQFAYMLPTRSIPAEKYYLKAYVFTAGADTKSSFKSSPFLVGHKSNSITEGGDERDSSVITNNVASEVEVTSIRVPEAEIKPVLVTDKERVLELVPETEKSFATTTNPINTSYDVRLTVEPSSKEPGVFKVLAKTKVNFDRMEFFIRNSASVQRTFIGVGTKVDDGYLYWLYTKSVPAGSYIVILQGRINGEVVYTATSESFVVTAPLLSTTGTQEEVREIKEITDTLEKPTSDIPNIDYLSTRKAYLTTPELLKTETTISPSAATPPVSDEDPVAVDRAKNLIDDRTTELNELMLRHASALQTNDETVTRLADEALKEEIKNLADEAGATSDDSAEMERLVTLEMERIKQKVEITENIIKARTNNKSTRDSDLDGISDYDEVTIYKTNPKEVDTDTDGVIDGVEIMRGYNPTNAVAEAVIDYSSPKEFGYVNEAVLKVENVSPLVQHDEETAEPVVASEIRGYGLPNSFVTLYIFSTPTVVTVKTNSDGSFAYVFEKELEDGEHEVYVALTDNTGDIVVKSNAFSFVKTAQAFTYEDELESAAVTTPAPLLSSEVSKTFLVTVAMSVVALGFVLVLLGHVLTTRRKIENIVA